MAKFILSKSSYIRSLQCLKSLYFYKFNYKDRDAISVEQQAKFDRGHHYGKLAHQLFPGGVDASPQRPFQYDESVVFTKDLMMRQQPVIYEAAFVYEQVLAALDILVMHEGRWTAYEIKSSTGISETYKQDAALQYFIIKGSGIDLDDFYIMHLHPDYKNMDAEDLKNLFVKQSLKDFCESQMEFVKLKIDQAKNIIINKRMPSISMGEQCDKPYPCDFKGICKKSNSFVENSLFDTF